MAVIENRAVIEWSGGVGGPVVLPVLAPLERDGVVMSRTFGADPAAPSSRRGVMYVPRRLLVRFALGTAVLHPEVGPMAVWLMEVPAIQTAVALAVGGLIAASRPAEAVPPVVCAGPPPVRRTRPMICHDVRAELGGRRVELAVWEIPQLDQPATPQLVAS